MWFIFFKFNINCVFVYFNLKIKAVSSITRKMGSFRNCNLGHAVCSKPLSSLEIKEKATLQRGAGRCFLEPKSLRGKGEFRMVTVSHWLGCIFLLAKLVALQGEILPSSWWSEGGFFRLEMQSSSLPVVVCNWQWVLGSGSFPFWPPNSFLNEAAFIQFHSRDRSRFCFVKFTLKNKQQLWILWKTNIKDQ